MKAKGPMSVQVEGVSPDEELFMATACWHGLKWKAVAETREEAVRRAVISAEREVWKDKPMQEADGYVA